MSSKWLRTQCVSNYHSAIKIFSYELIKKFNRDLSKDNDIENVLMIHGQEENFANIGNGAGDGELTKEIEKLQSVKDQQEIL